MATMARQNTYPMTWQMTEQLVIYPIPNKISWHLYFFNDISNVIVNAINSGIASVKANLKVHAQVNNIANALHMAG